ncbi:MAG: nuclear transport factor 2 family protein [Lysobacter sp.]|nr:nuclear transport factor 2 family protein [Lysobacter sp.]
MKTLSMFCVLLSAGLSPLAAQAVSGSDVDPLFDTISALDTEVFAAFNACSDPAQLDKHSGFFAPDIEFYHDTGGVTWNRDAMLANTRQYVCGHFRRELIPGSLEVFPVKDFGAIARGSHRFCRFDSGECEGMADFTIVWRQQDGKWTITRVLSYAHRAAS